MTALSTCPTPPTRGSLRSLLRQVIPFDSDLRMLCIDTDSLRPVLHHFGTGMSYEDMLNVLLSRVEPLTLVKAMDSCMILRERLFAHRHILQFEPTPSAETNAVQDRNPASVSSPQLLPPTQCAYDSAFYVSRPVEEEQAQNALSFPGAAVVLIGPERTGKTWLLQHLVGQLARGGSVVNLNLHAFSTTEVLSSYGGFLRELARQILVAALGYSLQQAAFTVEEAWRYSNNPIDNLTRLMERQILPSFTVGSGIPRRLILVLDGVEALGRQPYLADFFTLLRGWMEAAVHPPWSALRVLAAVSTSPGQLVPYIDWSHCHVAIKIELADFDDGQVAQLCAQYGLDWSISERRMLMQLVGGHPYLLRLAMGEARRRNRTVGELVSPASRVFTEFVAHCKRWLRSDPDLQRDFLRLLDDPRAPIGDDSIDRLRYAGLIIADDMIGACLPRYPLYHRLRTLN